jgi:hypothetical protein
VWGLFYPPTLADLDGSPVVVEMSSPEGEGHTKVVWRATGNGQFAVDARGPDGVRIGPVWIQEHIGSNWSRPGGEWDTGWDFPEPGCWTFTITRDDDEAEISIEVLPAG